MRDKKLHSQNLRSLTSDDICLLSYPRSGNTWLRMCMIDVLLQSKGYSTGTKLPLNIGLVIPTLDKHDINAVMEFREQQRVFKSHKWSEAVKKNHRIIYIYRNPLDVLRSYHRYFYKGNDVEGSHLLEFCQKRAHEWNEHISKALKMIAKKPDFVCLLSYEDLTLNGSAQLLKVFDFIGIDASKYVENAITSHQFDIQKKSLVEAKKRNVQYNLGEGQVGLGENMPDLVCSYIKEATWDSYLELQAISK